MYCTRRSAHFFVERLARCVCWRGLQPISLAWFAATKPNKAFYRESVELAACKTLARKPMPFATFLSLVRSMHRCSDMVDIASSREVAVGHGGALLGFGSKRAAHLPPRRARTHSTALPPFPPHSLRPPRTRTRAPGSRTPGRTPINGARAARRPCLRRSARDGGAPELGRRPNPTRAADAAAPRL